MSTQIHRLVAEAQGGTLPGLVCRLPSGWLQLAPKQVLRGYCLLLPDPVVPHLNALPSDARSRFLADMALAGDVLLRLTGAVRINYEMLGNLEPALHAHIIPRYTDEPSHLATRPVWFYDWDQARVFDQSHDGELLQRLAEELGR